MKAIIWLLLLLNFGLLVYFNADLLLPKAPTIKWVQLEPEKIRLLSEAEISALPKKSATPALAADTAEATSAIACYEWGVFSATQIANAQNATAQLSLQASVKAQTPSANKRFWVFMPPLKSTQAAQIQAAELKAQGVEDLFIVQDPRWKNAISFGLFEEEALAQNLLNDLKSKGVKNIEKALWNQKGESSLILSQVTQAQASALAALNTDFPEAKLKQISCQ